MAGSVPVRARLVAVAATSPSDGVSLRDARRADAGAIAAVRVAGWRSGYAGIITDDVLGALDPAVDEARWLADWDSGPRRRVAEVDGTVVGFTSTGPYRATGDDPSWPCGTDDGEVMAVYVDPGTWSRGVGRALLTDALESSPTRATPSRACGCWRPTPAPGGSTPATACPTRSRSASSRRSPREAVAHRSQRSGSPARSAREPRPPRSFSLTCALSYSLTRATWFSAGVSPAVSAGFVLVIR